MTHSKEFTACFEGEFMSSTRFFELMDLKENIETILDRWMDSHLENEFPYNPASEDFWYEHFLEKVPFKWDKKFDHRAEQFFEEWKKRY
jgi:hypothetical protein